MSYIYIFFNNFTHFEISYNSSLDIDHQSCGTALHKLYTCRQKAGLISKYLKNPLSKTLHFLTVLKFFGNSSEYQRKMRLFLLEVVFGRMASRQSIDTKTTSFSVPINNTKLTIFSIIIRLVPSFSSTNYHCRFGLLSMYRYYRGHVDVSFCNVLLQSHYCV